MKKNDRYIFPAVFTYEPDREIAVEFPDLDVATSGVDEADALLSARELLGVVLYGLEEDGEPIPEPTPLSQLPIEDNERVSLVDVFMPAVRLAGKNKSVNRTITLPSWLNALAMENNINFSQLLQEAIKTQLHLV